MTMLEVPVQRRFGWARRDGGLSVFFRKKAIHDRAMAGEGAPWALEAAAWMLRLLESGEASTAPTEDGVWIAGDDAVRLDETIRERFELPPSWPGFLLVEARSVPNAPDFNAVLRVLDQSDRSVANWDLDGPVLIVDTDEFYLPSREQFACLKAFLKWRSLGSRSESDHLRLLYAMAEAAKEGTRIVLRGTPDVEVVEGGECLVSFEELGDGSLELTPVFAALIGDGSPESLSEIRRQIARRLHHLDGSGEEAVVRVGKKIVLVDPEQTAGARALAKRRRVSAAERVEFLRKPSEWMAAHVFTHGEVEFLPRVLGVGEWTGGYLGAAGELGEAVDWFDKKPGHDETPTPEDEEIAGVDQEGEGERDNSQDEEEPDTDGVEEPIPTEGPLVPLIETNDLELLWGLPFGEGLVVEGEQWELCLEGLPRTPFAHQVEAVQWLAGHTARAGKPRHWKPGDKAWGAGALLADDMGLGKTLSTILFVGLWYERWRLAAGGAPVGEPPACLVVAPLSLVENWVDEVNLAFPADRLPFRRIVSAIPAADLRDYYATANGRDQVAEDGSGVACFGLKFGSGTDESLDCPGTLVITTYQTLREFRFSFAGCEWGAVIFDEAQQIKNPNALQTIAAKALKGFFRVALTGTPVENHLGDLWSLMDAIEPGALGSFSEFRTKWIRRLNRNPEDMETVGRELRDYLSRLILRRTKEERLPGLPLKHITATRIDMTAAQCERYDEILRLARSASREDSGTARNNHHLACMWELRRITLHPDLVGQGTPKRPVSEKGSRAYLAKSGKLGWLLAALDQIRQKGEKALIFAVQKSLQDMLVLHLNQIYGIPVPLINGDTKASSRNRPNETRLGLIKQFCERPGFGVCVLSPIAAGAGLNIVAANHVIHLERHWNPAKEDQATDRVYRIGLTNEVHVHLPLLVHPARPGLTTFDLGLDSLIRRKRTLGGSLGLIPPAPVTAEELFREVFGGDSNDEEKTSPKRLDLDEVLGLSWDMFEALVAELYSRDSDTVYLTPKGRDAGADVIVIGHGPMSRNLLIQCKQTSLPILNSEHAVREVIGATPGYQRGLNLSSLDRAVHTTASRFSRRTKMAARPEGIELNGRRWLRKAIDQHCVTLSELVKRNNARRRVV